MSDLESSSSSPKFNDKKKRSLEINRLKAKDRRNRIKADRDHQGSALDTLITANEGLKMENRRLRDRLAAVENSNLMKLIFSRNEVEPLARHMCVQGTPIRLIGHSFSAPNTFLGNDILLRSVSQLPSGTNLPFNDFASMQTMQLLVARDAQLNQQQESSNALADIVSGLSRPIPQQLLVQDAQFQQQQGIGDSSMTSFVPGTNLSMAVPPSSNFVSNFLQHMG